MNYSKLDLDQLGIETINRELAIGVYDPPYDLVGKTVLDVGATNGEVAYYYIEKFHAEKAICIECDPQRFVRLRNNARLLGNIEVVEEPFRIEHLQNFEYDFIKCDVEGYEMVLLEFVAKGGVLKPCVLEAHTGWIKDQFLKEGFEPTHPSLDLSVQGGINVCILNNYRHLGI